MTENETSTPDVEVPPRLYVTKKIVNAIASTCVGTVVTKALLRNTVSEDDSKLDRAKIVVGTAVVAGVAKEHTRPYMDKCVDDLAETYDLIRNFRFGKKKSETENVPPSE